MLNPLAPSGLVRRQEQCHLSKGKLRGTRRSGHVQGQEGHPRSFLQQTQGLPQPGGRGRGAFEALDAFSLSSAFGSAPT